MTPRFGVVAWPTDHFGAFFNYAQGFKAPSPTQVNQALHELDAVLHLDPEPGSASGNQRDVRSRHALPRHRRRSAPTWRASATAFSGEYEDFIEQVQVSGPPFGTGSPGNPSVFQVINLGEVSISGYEGARRWRRGTTASA